MSTEDTAAPDAPIQPRPVEQVWPVRFVGTGSEYFRIWIVNVLLVIVTLGLYYPWAKVRRLRYFHTMTEVAGQPLHFEGNPAAMLRGYLVVAGLVAANALAGHLGSVAEMVAPIVLVLIGPALWQAALRFRLANTRWRGLAMRFSGSMKEAYLAALPVYVLLGVLVVVGVAGSLGGGAAAARAEPPMWAVLLVPLVGLAYMACGPWLLHRLKRFQHGHYTLGQERTQFEARVRSFYGLALRTAGWGVAAVVVSIIVMVIVSVPGAAPGGGRRVEPSHQIGFWVGGALTFLLFQAGLRSYTVSRLQNLVWPETRSEHLRFVSRLRARDLAWLSLRNWVLIILTLGLYFPFAMVATARLRLQAVQVVSTLDADQWVSERREGLRDASGDAGADAFGLDIGL